MSKQSGPFCGAEVDANMVALIDALNEIEGVTTFSSCGGHDRAQPGQLPKGEFYVSMMIVQNSLGWKALAIITTAAESVHVETEYGDIALIPWTEPVEGSEGQFNLHFDLTAWGISPDAVAEAIRKQHEAIVTASIWANQAYVSRPGN